MVLGVVSPVLTGSDLGEALAGPLDQRTAFAGEFRDDAGHRRAIDPLVLAWVLKLPATAATPRTDRPDMVLWRALLEPTSTPVSEILRGEGPVAPALRSEGLEVWTSVELASLQAMWWHARRSDAARKRAVSHAHWLMAEIQPDNGTNHAWAVASFAELAAQGDTDAGLYAETLLHNCQVTLGKADRFSALLLVDALACLEAADESG